MPILSAENLRHVAQAILEAVGTPPDSAQVVSSSLVEADLVGHESHGIIRLLRYVPWVREGRIKPGVRPSVHNQNRATAQVDGAWGWGQLAALLATQKAMEFSTEYGVGAVTIGRCNHIGRLGEYVESIARAGMMGMAMCNSATAVAPFGGRQRVMGTNPLAWAVPRSPGQEPLVFDFATAAVAEGKLRAALAKGERAAAGLLLDQAGRPSQEPADFYAGGALLPFGGHKGYCISLMIEILGRALSGMDAVSLADYRGFNGTLVLALDIRAFVPVEQFTATVQALCATIKATPAAEGFGEVLLPGELEMLTRQRRLAAGVFLPDQTWNDIKALSREVRVTASGVDQHEN